MTGEPDRLTNWVGRLYWQRSDDPESDGAYELDYSVDNPVPEDMKHVDVVVIPVEEFTDGEWRIVRVEEMLPRFMDGQGDEWVHLLDKWTPGSAP